ncbi:hypothetical protein KL86PLE_90484 [uncultured Pleomorphomonas sp.]|uniref:Uncharacterized protein n=1 Tax=uncultured Pleomorphomonas sp. TaxID=442121 RepID=A0A212LQ17_9HYPH|nr:hypothetical protein KL86PLE_90484 [uncultured Pleomorphomonas sp.]
MRKIITFARGGAIPGISGWQAGRFSLN